MTSPSLSAEQQPPADLDAAAVGLPDGEHWDGELHAYNPSGPVRVPAGLRLHREAATDVDPVTYEVVRHSLWNANIDHARVIDNLAVSPVTVEVRDFQTCILTEDCELLYMGPCMQYMSGMLDIVTRYLLERRGERLRDGDMWLCNDPIIGGAHQPDVALMCPVFVDGELFCWVCNVAHQNDVGGTVPGSFCVNAEDVFWDPPCFPPIPIVREEAVDPDLEALYRRCSRTPEALSLDLRAAVAGNLAARRRVLNLVERYGKEVVKGTMRRVLDSSAAAFDALLETIPDGRWSERVLQEVARSGDRGVYPAQVTVRKRGNSLSFDDVGTHPQAGAMNLGFAGWRGTILALLNVMALADQMGCVGGATRRCTFEPVPGTMFCPDWGGACSPSGTYATELGISLAAAVIAKMMLSSADPEVRRHALTSQNSQWQVNFVTGNNQRGDFYVGALAENQFGAGPATCEEDGEFANGLVWVPDGRGPNAESYERDWPILYLYRREQADSAGAGRRRAGNGGEICYVPHKGDSALAVFTLEGIAKTMGVFGGDPGAIGQSLVLRDTDIRATLAAGRIPDDISEVVGEKAVLEGKVPYGAVDDDSVLYFNWAGPGGYGDPLRRELPRVAADLAAGAVSAAGALELYGAVVAGGVLDEAASEAERARRREQRLVAAGCWNGELRPSRALPDGARVIGDAYELDGEQGLWRCAGCGEGLGPLTENPRLALALLERPVDEALDRLRHSPAGIHHFVDAEVFWRELFCPGCGVRLAAEVATAGQELLDEMRLDIRPEDDKEER